MTATEPTATTLAAEPVKPFTWTYKGETYTSRLMLQCPTCGVLAVVALEGKALAEQPDDTTHVCHPAIGGCNGGFAMGPVDRSARS